MFSTPPPSPADFNIAKDSNGNTRPAVFDLSKIANRGVTYHLRGPGQRGAVRQYFRASLPGTRCGSSPCNQDAGLRRIQTPNYLQADASMNSFCDLLRFSDPARHERSLLRADVAFGRPQRRPPSGGSHGGWPVVIWDTPTRDRSERSQNRVAAVFAKYGIATLSWNQIGYGFGPNSTVTNRPDGWSVAHVSRLRAALTTSTTRYPAPRQRAGRVLRGSSAQPKEPGASETRAASETRVILFDRDPNRQGNRRHRAADSRHRGRHRCRW